MTKQIPTLPIEAHSGKRWEQWMKALDAKGARTMSHANISKLCKQQMLDGWWDMHAQPKIEWWAQSIAIAYEQQAGLRRAGQQSDGLYAATVSRTVAGDAQSLFAAWCTHNTLAGHAEPRISQTPKRLYWRVSMDDGTKTEVAFEPKANGRVLLSLSQMKLADQSSIEPHKAQLAAVADAFLDQL